MKKCLLSFVAVAVMAIVSYAQVSFAIMPKAGASFGVSRMGLDNYKDQKMKAGVIGGIGFPISFGNYFEVQPEVYYIQKNSEFTSQGDDVATTVTSKRFLRQYEIPVLFRAKVNGLYVNMGPSVTFNADGYDEVNKAKTDFKFGNAANELKKTIWGAQFGLGYNFELGYGKLNLDARYGLGFTDMDNITGDKNTTRADALAVSVGYIIPIGGNGLGEIK